MIAENAPAVNGQNDNSTPEAPPDRRVITLEELRLLADAILVEFPELRAVPRSLILRKWCHLAERHGICVEPTRSGRGGAQ